ncbi:hypothetical protein SNE40_000529 [Patella caerulea]|uniref:Uncharacterized protein n=1 Tax=Patella caerulea TaxID=87958 RepID=A0AAN8KH83_PATCE
MADDLINIINNANFENPSEDEKDKFNRSVEKWSISTEGGSPDEIVDICCSAFKALKIKTCVDNFGKDSDSTLYMVKKLIGAINEQIFDEEFDDKRDIVNELYVDYLIDILKLDPRISHLKVVEYIFEDGRQFIEYLERYSVDEWKIVLKAFQKQFTPHPEEDVDEFYRCVKAVFGQITHVRRLPDNVKEALQEDYLELYIFFRLSLSDAVTYKGHAELVDEIQFPNRGPYMEFENAEVYKAHLKKILDVVNDPDCKDGHLENIESVLSDIVKGLKETNQLENICGDTVDFISTLCNKTTGPNISSLLQIIGQYYFHVHPKQVKGKTSIFDTMAPKLAVFMETLHDHSHLKRHLIGPAFDILDKSTEKCKEHRDLWIRLLKAAITIPGCHCVLGLCVDNINKSGGWKESKEDAVKIYSSFAQVRVEAKSDDLDKEEEERCNDYNHYFKEFLEGLKKAKLTSSMIPDLVDYSLKLIEGHFSGMFESVDSAVGYTEDLNLKDHRDIIFETFRRVATPLKNTDYTWTGAADAVTCLLDYCVQALSKATSLSEDELNILLNFVMVILEAEFDDLEEGIHIMIFRRHVGHLFLLLAQHNRLASEEKVITLYLTMLHHDDEEIRTCAVQHLATMGESAKTIFSPYFTQLSEAFFKTEQFHILSIITAAYHYNKEPMKEHFQKLFEYMKDTDDNIRITLIQLLVVIANTEPELFTEDNVDDLIDAMHKHDLNTMNFLLTILAPLATHNPGLFHRHLDRIIAGPENDLTFYHLYTFLVNIVMNSETKLAQKVVDYFMKVLKDERNVEKIGRLLDEIKRLVLPHHAIINPHKQYFQQYRQKTTDSNILERIDAILSLLENRSLKTLSNENKQQEVEIENLDERVAVTSNEAKIKYVAETAKTKGTAVNTPGNSGGTGKQSWPQTSSPVKPKPTSNMCNIL